MFYTNFDYIVLSLHFPGFNASIQTLTDDNVAPSKRKIKNRTSRKRKEDKVEAVEDSPATEKSAADEPPLVQQSPQVLMVQVENVVHDKFVMNEEVKALTQEIIKTIRDILALNPLYRESIQQMLHQGQRVVDNPVYLADLGAALTAAEPADLQEVINEINVSSVATTRARITLGLKQLETASHRFETVRNSLKHLVRALVATNGQDHENDVLIN